MDLMDGPKDGFYPIQTCLWLKESNKERMMILAGIADQTIMGTFRVGEGVKLNNVYYSDFMDKTFCSWYKSLSCSFKMKCVFKHDNAPSHIPLNIKIYWRNDNEMATIKSRSESDQKSMVNCEDEII